MSAIVMACVYALWLAAGWLDFHFHRRTDLPHTSALRESALHGLQLLLIGSGVLAWLLLENTRSLVALLALLVIAHAITGYFDTVSADGRRRISPAEQHVHSRALGSAGLGRLARAAAVVAERGSCGA